MANNCNKLMKEAIDVAVNEFRGIEFTYKLDDVLDSLSPNQKFSAEQLKGYLLKQGVSPNEIKASKIFDSFESDNRALSISDWRSIEGQQKFSTELTHDYDDITLGIKGEGNDTYRAKLFGSYPRELDTNVSHFYTQAYANPVTGNPEETIQKSILGWNRVHQDEINGKPTTVLNELQSDWMQAERQGAGVFESKAVKNNINRNELDLLKEEYNNLGGTIMESNYNDSIELPADAYTRYEELRDIIFNAEYSINTKVIADFPMKPEKFQQLMIVDALNEAIENGTKRVAIPIERENELAGSSGVTKFYEQLNKKVLPDIRKKLEKQGMRIKVSMEDYKGELNLGVKVDPNYVDLETNRIYDQLDEDLVNELYTGGMSGGELEDSIYQYLMRSERFGPNSLFDEIDKLLVNSEHTIETKNDNRLYILEIEEAPNARVKWDVYGLLASLGLGGLASQSEAAEPISTTSGKATRETNSMMETMRLEGQPNIFRLQDLATGRTQVSKAKPKEKEILDYFSQKESKGDYNAKSTISSAYGKYQFLKGTLAEKAKAHGMTVNEAKTLKGQEELMRKVLKDYETRLRKFDLPVTKENLFVVHNLGETGGIRAIRGTYTSEDIERMRNNIPGTQRERNGLSKNEVVKEYYKLHKVTRGS